MKDIGLKDKVVLVTGGGGGLGRALCLAFAQAGADIVVSDMRIDPMVELREEVIRLGRKAISVRCNVTISSEVNEMVDKALSEFGRVDVLVNNAGVVRDPVSGMTQVEMSKPIWEVTDQEWHIGIDTNLTGTFFCSRAIARHMIERRSGAVINIASGAGIRGVRDFYIYCSAKAGVALLTQSLAHTWAGSGIRVNAIAPGTFRTFRSKEEYEKRGRFVPIGRVGEPEEISNLAVFLASEAGSYISGQIFIIDGGSLAGGYAPIGFAPVIPLGE